MKYQRFSLGNRWNPNPFGHLFGWWPSLNPGAGWSWPVWIHCKIRRRRGPHWRSDTSFSRRVQSTADRSICSLYCIPSMARDYTPSWRHPEPIFQASKGRMRNSRPATRSVFCCPGCDIISSLDLIMCASQARQIACARPNNRPHGPR